MNSSPRPTRLSATSAVFLTQNPTRRELTARLALLVAALGLGAQGLQAQQYIYTPTNATTDVWSAGTNWTPGAPVSAATTQLTFTSPNTTVFANNLVNTNTNDLGAFQLNILDLQGTGPGTAAMPAVINLNAAAGSSLNLVSNGALTPVVNLNALAGTGGLTYNVNQDVALTNNALFTGNGTANFNFTGVFSGAGNFTKAGTSTLVSTGTNTYTGAVTVNGGTYTLGGANGSILSTSSITLNNNGVLRLDNSTASNTNRVADTLDINSNGGGFSFTNSAVANTVYSETVGQLNANAGLTVVTTSSANATGGSSTLTFSALNRAVGTTVSFATTTNLGNANGLNKILFTAAPTLDSSGLIGGWATAGGTDFVTYGANGVAVTAYTAHTEPNWVAGDVISVAAATTLTGNRVIDALKFRLTASAALDLGGFTLRLQSGGLVTSAGSSTSDTIQNGFLTAGANVNTAAELFLNNSTGSTRPLLLNAQLTDNGTGSVSVVISNSGGGQVSLGNIANNYTGPTTVVGNGGLLSAASGVIPDASSLTLSGGTTWTLAGFNEAVNGLSGSGTITSGSGNATTIITVGSANGDGTFTGNFSTSSSSRQMQIVKNGTGTETLGGTVANTFTNAITVNNGILIFNKTAGLDQITTGTVTVAGGTLRLGAAEQINNAASIAVTGGTFDLNNNTETITNLTYQAGAVQSTGGTQTLSLNGTGAAALSMRNTTIPASVNIAFNSTGAATGMTFDATNNGTATILGNVNLNTSATTGLNRTFTVADGTATRDVLVRGIISNTTATGLVKAGAGTLALGAPNTYSGATVINAGGGTLEIANDTGETTTGRLVNTSSIVINGGTLLLTGNASVTDRLNNAAPVTLNSGTLGLNGLSEGSAGVTGVGALTLAATSTIDFGPTTGTANSIQFAALPVHTAGVLTIINWEGTPGAAAGTDQLLFAGTSGDFTTVFPNQTDVSFNGNAGYATQDFGTYYEVYAITAVPEPTTVLAGCLMVIALGWNQRRRLTLLVQAARR